MLLASSVRFYWPTKPPHIYDDSDDDGDWVDEVNLRHQKHCLHDGEEIAQYDLVGRTSALTQIRRYTKASRVLLNWIQGRLVIDPSINVQYVDYV